MPHTHLGCQAVVANRSYCRHALSITGGEGLGVVLSLSPPLPPRGVSPPRQKTASSIRKRSLDVTVPPSAIRVQAGRSRGRRRRGAPPDGGHRVRGAAAQGARKGRRAGGL